MEVNSKMPIAFGDSGSRSYVPLRVSSDGSLYVKLVDFPLEANVPSLQYLGGDIVKVTTTKYTLETEIPDGTSAIVLISSDKSIYFKINGDVTSNIVRGTQSENGYGPGYLPDASIIMIEMTNLEYVTLISDDTTYVYVQYFGRQ